MKKTIYTLLVIIISSCLPVQAYEYFTIYFSDGTKSEAFYATDVDSICYSKLSLDCIAYDDWQVQEIYTCDSVYRYPLSQIDSLSFKDVNVNQLAEDIAHVSTYVNPLYLQYNSSTELFQRLESIDNIDGVEKVWYDNQSVFVKVRDGGVITYSYPPQKTPVINRNGSRAVPTKIIHRLSLNSSESITHKHATINNVCVITQTRKDKEYKESVATSDSIIKMCKGWGYNVTINNDLRPEFFINDIKKYNLIFLMTHGMYNGSHWLYTNEEIYSMTIDKPVNEDSLCNVAKDFIKTNYIDKGFSPNEVYFSPHIENRNGNRTLICYTCISNSFISKQKASDSKNIVVFNTACQSMKDGPEMAKAFGKIGASCYTGFSESNSIGPWTNWDMCEMLLNGLSIYSTYKTLPEELYKEKLELPENSGKFVYPELILWPDNKEQTSICITHPETLTAEADSLDGKSIIKLKGKFRVWNPEMYTITGLAGLIYSKTSDMLNAQFVESELKAEKNNHLLIINGLLKESELQPNTTYYYRAYMYDGYSYCFGEIKQFTTNDNTSGNNAEPYCVNDKWSTLTFYYDNKKNERDGKVFEIKELYDYNMNILPAWVFAYIGEVVFDSSFANYYPVSTAYWFYNQSYLRKISLVENLNTVNVTNMSNMFSYCEELKSLDLSSFNTANVKDMSSMFFHCNALKNLNVYNFNTANVTNMSGMFSDCSSLTSLNVSSFNTANVTNMSGMFSFCSSLTSLNVSSFNTANVTNMSDMFSHCSSLTSLDLNSFNTANVTNMGGMFSCCEELKSLDLSSFNTANVTNMMLMFINCYSLTSLDLWGFDTYLAKKGGMFGNCSSLKTIYAGNWSASKMDLLFGGCPNLVGGMGTKLGKNFYGYDDKGNPLYYYCYGKGDAARIDGGKDNPGLFTAK